MRVGVVMTFPQTKAMALLALAALLTALAAMVIGISLRTAPSARGVTTVVAQSDERVSPGSTASARSLYRASLGR